MEIMFLFFFASQGADSFLRRMNKPLITKKKPIIKQKIAIKITPPAFSSATPPDISRHKPIDAKLSKDPNVIMVIDMIFLAMQGEVND